MIPQIHQSIDDLLRTANPDTKLAWQQIRLIIGENASVQQLVFTGLVAGSEFLTYDVNKYYFALQLDFNSSTTGVSQGYVSLYNRANAVTSYNGNNSAVWNTTAAAINFLVNDMCLKNVGFSRILASGYAGINFIGFKFTC